MDAVKGNIIDSFEPLEDFRVIGRCDHKLIDIIMLSICAVICGADTCVGIHDFGVVKETWLRKFLELPNGIPSHDTIGRVLSLLNPVKFEACFLNWVQDVFQVTGEQIIPIDGKTLRRSYDRKSDKAPIHMVSAWGARNGIVLGQIKTNEKSNEITAIPELLNLLEISGCIITIDAMGCQKEIAKTIIENKADYVLAVKDNQPTLYKEIVESIDDAIELESSNTKTDLIDYYETEELSHGRKETRRYYIMDQLDDVPSSIEWEGLNSIGMVETIRTVDNKTSTNRRYFIGSIEKNAQSFGVAVRSHWGIENSLHWILDVSFREDDCRVRKNNAPENFSVVRRAALNLLKNETTMKRGVKLKRQNAGWNTEYLEKVIDFK